MQMKTTKSHLSEWPSSINQQETSASEDVEKGEPFGIGGGNADYCSQQCGFAQKIKNGTALWPSDFTSGNLSKETQHTNLKEYIHPCVHCSVICNGQDLEHLHNEYYSAIKKKEILPFATAWMDLKNVMLMK